MDQVCLYPPTTGDHIVTICKDDGLLRASSLLALSSNATPEAVIQTADAPISGFIVHLAVVTSVRSGDKVVIGGASDGGVVVWDFE